MKIPLSSILSPFILLLAMGISGLLKAQDPCQIHTDMVQMRLTCNNSDADNGNTAQIKVNVTDGVAPYSYVWEKDRQAIGLSLVLCTLPPRILRWLLD